MLNEEISRQAILCPVCHETYFDPRILPCGESVCNECIILEIEQQKSDIFKCSLCNKNHSVPEDGFPINKLGAYIYQVVDPYVNRQKYNTTLAKMSGLIKPFFSSKQNGIHEIKTHCAKLRDQVALEAENLIKEIRSSNDRLADEINNYEAKCIEQFNSRNDLNSKLEDNLIKASLSMLQQDQTKCMSQPESSDAKEIESKLKKAQYFTCKLDSEISNLDRAKYYGGKKMIFVEDKSKIIGQVLPLIFDLNHIDFSSLNTNSDNYYDIAQIKKNHWVYLDQKANENADLFLINQKGEILVQKCDFFQNVKILSIHLIPHVEPNKVLLYCKISFSRINIDNMKIAGYKLTVQLQRLNIIPDTFEADFLCELDSNLNMIKCKEVISLNNVCAFKDLVYSINASEELVRVIDPVSLEVRENIDVLGLKHYIGGQYKTDGKRLFYFYETLEEQDQRVISVLNLDSNAWIIMMKVSADKFVLTEKNQLFFYSNQTQKLFVYDIGAKSLDLASTFKVDLKEKNYSMSVCKDCVTFFNDKKLYFLNLSELDSLTD